MKGWFIPPMAIPAALIQAISGYALFRVLF